MNIEICQRMLDGKEMPDEWHTSVLMPIFKGKADVWNKVYNVCNAYSGIKL